MKLKDYLKNKCRHEFAAKIGTTKPYVDRLLYGANPGKHLALKIQEATGGQVTIMELLYPDMPVVSPIAQNVTECRETA